MSDLDTKHEELILAALWNDDRFRRRMLRHLEPEYFSSSVRSWIYKQIREIHANGDVHVDPTVIHGAIRLEYDDDGDYAVVYETFERVRQRETKDVNTLAKHVFELVQSSRFLDAHEEATKLIEQGDVAQAIEVQQAARIDQLDEAEYEYIDWAETIEERAEERREKAENPHIQQFVNSGFAALNRALEGGLAPGLHILAGKTNRGKSAMSINFMHTTLLEKWAGIYFSTEMAAEPTALRLDTRFIGLPHAKLKLYDMTDMELRILKTRMAEARAKYTGKARILHTTLKTMTHASIEEQLEQAIADLDCYHKDPATGKMYPRFVVFFDSGQHFIPDIKIPDMRLRQVANAEFCKNIADKYKVPVIVTAHLNKGENDQRGSAEGIKESYDWGTLADTVLTLDKKHESKKAIPKEDIEDEENDEDPVDVSDGLVLTIAKARSGVKGIQIPLTTNLQLMFMAEAGE